MEPTQTPRVLSGRYELSHLVARGGMAEVYRAHDRLLDRPVALKVLFPELSVDRAFVERFRREAQAAANLSHPNIVPVFDWGEDGGTYFIVMEFIDGRALSSILRTAGPMHPDRAAEIAADVAIALAYAHRHGVIHRDVKPGNVLITEDGTVKVTDFGIARAINTEESLTQTGAVMGTATYFSPEQAEGMGVDARSDIYSLGVVLFEMVTGRPPFMGDTPVAVASKHVRENPPDATRDQSVGPARPRSHHLEVPGQVARVPLRHGRRPPGRSAALPRGTGRGGRGPAHHGPDDGDAPRRPLRRHPDAAPDRRARTSRNPSAAGPASTPASSALLLVALGRGRGLPRSVPRLVAPRRGRTSHHPPERGRPDRHRGRAHPPRRGAQDHGPLRPDRPPAPNTQVIRTSPAKGTKVQKGSTVELVTGGRGPLTHGAVRSRGPVGGVGLGRRPGGGAPAKVQPTSLCTADRTSSAA